MWYRFANDRRKIKRMKDYDFVMENNTRKIACRRLFYDTSLFLTFNHTYKRSFSRRAFVCMCACRWKRERMYSPLYTYRCVNVIHTSNRCSCFVPMRLYVCLSVYVTVCVFGVCFAFHRRDFGTTRDVHMNRVYLEDDYLIFWMEWTTKSYTHIEMDSRKRNLFGFLFFYRRLLTAFSTNSSPQLLNELNIGKSVEISSLVNFR